MKIVTAELIIADKKVKGKISEVSAENFRNKLSDIKQFLSISENETVEEILWHFIRNAKRATIGNISFERFNKQIDKLKSFLYEIDENGNEINLLNVIDYSMREKLYYEKNVYPSFVQINKRCEEFEIEPLKFDEIGREIK